MNEALRELIATLLDQHLPTEAPGCICGWRVDMENPKVYDWQHRLHRADVILAALAALAASGEREVPPAKTLDARAELANKLVAAEREWLDEQPPTGAGTQNFLTAILPLLNEVIKELRAASGEREGIHSHRGEPGGKGREGK